MCLFLSRMKPTLRESYQQVVLLNMALVVQAFPLQPLRFKYTLFREAGRFPLDKHFSSPATTARVHHEHPDVHNA